MLTIKFVDKIPAKYDSDEGVYLTDDQTILIAKDASIETLMHEVGHHVINVKGGGLDEQEYFDDLDCTGVDFKGFARRVDTLKAELERLKTPSPNIECGGCQAYRKQIRNLELNCEDLAAGQEHLISRMHQERPENLGSFLDEQNTRITAAHAKIKELEKRRYVAVDPVKAGPPHLSLVECEGCEQLEGNLRDLGNWKCTCGYWSPRGNVCHSCKHDPSIERDQK
jgi:hypothetical protein